MIAQEALKPVVLDSVIGDTLDAMKRAEFVLLPDIHDFEKAVFYLNPDSSLGVRVFMLRDGVLRDSIIAKYHDVAWMRNRIATVGKIRAGMTTPPEDPAVVQDRELRFGTGKNIVIRLDSEQVVEGELVAVRDSAIVLNISDSRGKRVLSENDVFIVRLDQIKQADFPTLHSGLYTFIGTVTGVVVGALLGYLWASSLRDPPVILHDPEHPSINYRQGGSASENAMGFGLYGGAIAGGLIGLFVGANAYHESYTDMSACFPMYRIHARYPDTEPDYLKKL